MTKLALTGGALAAAAVAGETPAAEPGGKLRVLLVNGSPHMEGCTYTALNLVAQEIEASGVGAEIFYLGTAPVQDCMACGSCKKPLHLG